MRTWLRAIATALAWMAGIMFGLWAGVGIVRADDTRLLASLRSGGNIVLIRHAATEPGIGDPADFRVDDCSTQRNLSEAGREDARRMGEALRAAGVPIAAVRSSRWCRCLETAELAFGAWHAVEPWAVLDSLFGRAGEREARRTRMLDAAAGVPADGNWVWVTHQANITALTGEFTAMGEALVVRPDAGGGLRVQGRWRAR